MHHCHPQTKLLEGNVSTPVCDSVHRGWGGMHDQGGMHGRGHAFQGVCVAGGHARWGACVAGEMDTKAGGTHPTGMHSC